MQRHLSTSLQLERCPHCALAQPQLARINERENNRRGGHRRWGVYECLACGGLVVAAALAGDPAHIIVECYPAAPNDRPDTIPTRPRLGWCGVSSLPTGSTGSFMREHTITVPNRPSSKSPIPSAISPHVLALLAIDPGSRLRLVEPGQSSGSQGLGGAGEFEADMW